MARVLELLSDLPAGKLAIAALAAPTSEDLAALERAGVDAALIDLGARGYPVWVVTRIAILLAAGAVLVAGCGGKDAATTSATGAPATTCPKAWKAGWQKLANDVGATVYCPSWMPEPVDARIGGIYKNGRWVSKDQLLSRQLPLARPGRGRQRSEVHVNFRGYPGRTTIPSCESTARSKGRRCHGSVPCFADRGATKRLGSITATVVHRESGHRRVARALPLAPRRTRCTRSAEHVVVAVLVRAGRDRTSSASSAASFRSSRRSDMRLTRRALLGSAAAGALAAAGDLRARRQAGRLAVATRSGTVPPEQHLLDGIGVVVDNDVEVLVPPLHHQVVTATLAVSPRPADLTRGGRDSRAAIRRLESRYDATPAGLGSHRRLGHAVLRSLRPAAGGAPPARRQARDGCRRSKTVRALDRRDPLPERPARDASRGERCRGAPAERPPRPHRGRGEDAVRRARRHLPRDEHPQGLRRGRVRRLEEPAEADGDGRRRARARI